MDSDPTTPTVSPDDEPTPGSREFRPGVSWGAVAAGLSTALAAQVTLYFLAVTMGGQPEAWTLHNPEDFVWALLGAALPGTLGAWMAGRLCGTSQSTTGALHGFLAWSAAILIGVLMPFSGGLGMLTSGSSLTRDAAKLAVTPSESHDRLQTRARRGEDRTRFVYPGETQPFTPTGRHLTTTNQPLEVLARTDAELSEAVALLEWTGGAAQSPRERERVRALLVGKLGMDSRQADETILEWDKKFLLARAKREQVSMENSQKASRTAARVALLGFLILALGGMIAAGGGWSGAASVPQGAQNRAVEPAEHMER